MALQEFQPFDMGLGIGRHYLFPKQSIRPTGEVGDAATCLYDQQNPGRHIPWAQAVQGAGTNLYSLLFHRSKCGEWHTIVVGNLKDIHSRTHR
jgi:hypothetical protein